MIINDTHLEQEPQVFRVLVEFVLRRASLPVQNVFHRFDGVMLTFNLYVAVTPHQERHVSVQRADHRKLTNVRRTRVC